MAMQYARKRGARLIILASVLVMGLGSVAQSEAQDQYGQGLFLRIDAGIHLYADFRDRDRCAE